MKTTRNNKRGGANKSTSVATDKSTSAVTSKATDKSTSAVTSKTTSKTTNKSTSAATSKATDKSTSSTELSSSSVVTSSDGLSSTSVISSSIDSSSKTSEATNFNDKEDNDLKLQNIYLIPEPKTNILEYNNVHNYHDEYPYPLLSLGFHHFIHQSKNNMLHVTQEFKGRKKPYNIIHKYSEYIEEYENDIKNSLKQYLEFKIIPDPIDHQFYEIWELLMTFDIVNKSSPCVFLSNNGSFLQSVMLYKNKFYKNNDNMYICTYKGNKEENIKLLADKKICNLQEISDLSNIEDIDKFIKYYNNSTKSKASLIIGSALNTKTFDKEGKYRNTLEQDSYGNILGEILIALNILETNGNMVLKIYETYTRPTIKIMLILKMLFSQVYIYKPLISRKHKSYKYLVCINKLPKDMTNIIKIIRDLVDKIDINRKNNKYLNDIFVDYDIQDNKTDFIINNTELSNQQFKTMNEIITFINGQTFRGEEYYNRREEQIKNTELWKQMFLPQNIVEHKVYFSTLVQTVSDLNIKKSLSLSKIIDH